MNMKNNLTKVLMLLSFTVVLVTSCTSYKKVPYLQNSKDFESVVSQATVTEPVIQPYDMLTITVVSTQDLKAAMKEKDTIKKNSKEMQSPV